MTALLGKTLLFAGCTAFGLLRGSRLRQRTPVWGSFAGRWRGWPGSWPFPCALCRI